MSMDQQAKKKLLLNASEKYKRMDAQVQKKLL